MNNKPKTKLLTIGLLCCGRPETTERCLKSLMPIREAIDSELQVVDTGCEPETRAIIEKYADEVFEFTWIKDFAAARNFQLDQANGKMFLFIDDDEWFLDTKYIIEFFKNPKCIEYNLGGYFQRNYLDFEAKEYEDIEVVRMCSVTPETHFVGKVHEYIEPSFGNAMFMDARAGHFGYVYKDEKDNIAHSMRNIPLLEEMWEEMPDNLRWPYQLAQELRAIKDYDRLYEVCHKGYYDSFDIQERESLQYRGPFMIGMVIALEAKEKFDEILKLYNEQMAKDEIMPIPKAKFSIYAARIMFTRNMNEECVKAAQYYFDIYEKFGKDRGQMFVQGGIFINDTYDELHTNMMYCYIMTCGMRNNDFGPLVHYYRRISWNSLVVRINRGFVITLIDKACEYGNKREIRDVLNKFFIRPGFRDVLQKEIDNSAAQLTDEQLNNLLAVFNQTDGKKEMSMFINIRLMERAFHYDEYASIDELQEKLNEYIDLVDAWYDLHQQWIEEEDNAATPTEVQLVNVIKQFFELQDNATAALTSLKNIMGLRPMMDEVVKNLSKFYTDIIKVRQAKANDPAKFQEMYNLEEALLKQIADLDAAVKTDEAVATYQQLVEIIRNAYGVDSLHI